jgi:hypothetical protein
MANGEVKREHEFHAEAEVLKGSLRLPLVQEIKTQASAKLAKEGGYLSQHEQDYRLEGVIAFRHAYTQTSGNPGLKAEGGWTTLSTSVVEELNILDVVTADRVVSQVSLHHPKEGYVPRITFLGTRFDNLRIAGVPVDAKIDLKFLGPKPDGDAPYSRAPGFFDKVNGQHENVRAHPNLIEDFIRRYTGYPTQGKDPEAIECSLVHLEDGLYPGQRYGHVIDIPDFGVISLANLRIEQTDPSPITGMPMKTLVQLTMIEARMGCIAEGDSTLAVTKNNGLTMP